MKPLFHTHYRACATVIPTKIVQEKLWLWPDSSPEGFAASELTSPVVLPDMDREEFGGNWYMRELEYGYDSLVENLCGERERRKEGIGLQRGQWFATKL